MHPQITRRTLFAGLAAAPALVAAGRPVRLGGPIYLKSTDPRELAREHRRLGYSAAYCPGIKIDDAKATREAYAAENVVIAEVGAWKNMLDPNDEVRKANVAYVIERLALADAVGARCCVDIAGSYNPKVWYGPHPKNLSKEFFDATVENCRRVIDQVKPTKTTFSIEMMGWAIPDGPDSYLKLIRSIDRKAFSVHMDICNSINSPTRYYNSAAFIEETFQKLGKYVLSCHGKDLKWIPEQNVHFLEVPPGDGGVDYRAYLREISKTSAPLLLEHFLTNEDFERGARYVKKIGAEIGVDIGFNAA